MQHVENERQLQEKEHQAYMNNITAENQVQMQHVEDASQLQKKANEAYWQKCSETQEKEHQVRMQHLENERQLQEKEHQACMKKIIAEDQVRMQKSKKEHSEHQVRIQNDEKELRKLYQEDSQPLDFKKKFSLILLISIFFSGLCGILIVYWRFNTSHRK